MHPIFSFSMVLICLGMAAFSGYTYKLEPKLNPLGPFLVFLWSAIGIYWGYLGVTGL